MKILFIILLIFYFNYSKAQSKQDVVNDTLWTLQMETFNSGITVSLEHNLFYTSNRYTENNENYFYIASYNLDNALELERKYYGQNPISIIYYELQDKIIVNVRDSLYFLDPLTLDIVNKIKLPPYLKNEKEISDYKFYLDKYYIVVVNKYLKISPKDKKTNRTDISFIYNIENNEFIKTFNSNYETFFNSDESLFIQCYENGFDIYNTTDWTIIHQYRTEYKYYEDEFKYRYSKYRIDNLSFAPDGSRIALAVFREGEDENNRIEIFNTITKQFEESFQILYIEGLGIAKGKAKLHFINNNTLMLERENVENKPPEIFIYKLNSNGNLIEFPQQSFEAGFFIDLYENDILCYDFGSSYARVNVSPELFTSVNENIKEITSIFPNPTSDIINIDTKEATIIELSDIIGNKILEDYNTKLDISHLSPGTYYIRFLGQTRMVVKI